MHTASRPIRCAFCGPTHELDQVHHDACASCVTETVARLTTCPLEGASLSQVPAATYDKLLDEPRVPAPTELMALNGGHPVAPALAQLVWLLAHQLVESEQQLDALTAVLHPHGYVDNGEAPWEAVQNAVADAEEREAVSEALLYAGSPAEVRGTFRGRWTDIGWPLTADVGGQERCPRWRGHNSREPCQRDIPDHRGRPGPGPSTWGRAADVSSGSWLPIPARHQRARHD